MTGKTTGPGPRKDRPIRWVVPRQHDTYHAGAKPKRPIVCKTCGLLCRKGRWVWGVASEGEFEFGTCPACQRVRDRYPAGTIRLHPRYDVLRDEIRGLVANVEALERAEHPLERIFEFRDTEDGILITTTGIHIARRIAAKLARRLHRRGVVHYPPEQNLVFIEFDA